MSSETLVDRCNNISGFALSMKVVKREKCCHCDDRMQMYPDHCDEFAIPAIGARPYAVRYFRNCNRKEERCRKVRW